MYKFILGTWALTVGLVLYRWLHWDNLLYSIFVTAFLILVAVLTTKHALKSAKSLINAGEQKEPPAPDHTNTPALKRKYGKFYHLRIYWALFFFVISVIASDTFPDSIVLEKLSWLAMVLFFADGIYLCVTKFCAERKC